jgi:hypothetical protein
MAVLFIAALCVPTLTAQIVAPAGSVIGNQATATYTDANNVSRQTFSNLVQTSVTQVYLGTLATSQAKYATAGSQVLFPHTYTNTGNGPDTVTFNTASVGANLSNVAIYLDANGDGIPDNTTNLAGSTLQIATGGVIKVVAVATLNAGTASCASGCTFQVTAADHAGGTVSGTPNTDTINLSTNGVINVTKSMTVSATGIITVTLTYTNTGNNTATAVTIADPLKTEGYFTYTAGTATWNGVAFADATPPTGLAWSGYAAATNAPQAVITSVAPGVTGNVTFQVTSIVPTVYPATYTNYATYQYNDGTGTTIGPYNTNIVNYLINGYDFAQFTAGTPGTFTASTVSGAGATQNHTSTGTNIIASASYNQGATISWTDTITNNGVLTDTYNLALSTTGAGVTSNPTILAANQFPAGTVFQLYRADGKTPLTDSNGDGIIDAGPLAPGTNTQVVITATLPAGITITSATTYIVNLVASPTNTTATNFGGATVIADGSQLEVIISSTKNASVDLTLSATDASAAGNGTGAGKNGNGTVYSGNPGTVIAVPFYVFNTGTNSAPDTYNLSFRYSNTAVGDLGTPLTPFTGAQAGTVPGPSGSIPAWTVSVAPSTSATCATYGSAVTATSVIAAAGSSEYCLLLQVPGSYPAGTYQFVIQAQSNATNAIDQMAVQATVNTLHSVSISPNNQAQIYAGGTVVYKHVVTNGGNATETTVSLATPTLLAAPAGWTVATWLDTNNNGVLDSSDTSLTTPYTIPTIAPGASITYFVVVQAPASANPGDQQIATWTLSLTGNTSSSTVVTDTSTVVNGQVKLVKSQQTIVHTGVSTCSTAPVGGNWTTGAGSAASKDCVFYQVVATNTGTTNVTVPSISDTAPPYTTPYASYNSGKPLFSNTCSLTDPTPAFGGNNQFTGTYAAGNMTPGCTITVVFEVQLN